MEIIVLVVRAVVHLAFWSFSISLMWRHVVVPKFKLPELGIDDVSFLLLLFHTVMRGIKDLSETTEQLSSKIVSLL